MKRRNNKLTLPILAVAIALAGFTAYTFADPDIYESHETSAVLDQTDAQPQTYETMTEGEPMAYLAETQEETYRSNKTLKEAFPRHSDYNAEIESDIEGYYTHKQSIRELKAELKADRKADREQEVIDDKQELKIAKANKKVFKAYFMADKAALKQHRKAEIADSRKAVCEDKKDLRQAKRQVRKDLRQDNSTALLQHSQAVIAASGNLDESTAQLDNQKGSYAANMVAIGQTLDEAQTDYVALGKSNREASKDASESTAMAK